MAVNIVANCADSIEKLEAHHLVKSDSEKAALQNKIADSDEATQR